MKKLWLSWDRPDGERTGGPLWDETTARHIDHHGEFFDVAGPLNVPIGPQGHPVIAQAGASDAGIDLAAKHADLVYASIYSKDAAAAYGAQIRRRAAAYGRDPHAVRLLPGLVVVIADTHEEALRRHEALRGASGEDQLITDFLRRTNLEGRGPPAHPAGCCGQRRWGGGQFSASRDPGRFCQPGVPSGRRWHGRPMSPASCTSTPPSWTDRESAR